MKILLDNDYHNITSITLCEVVWEPLYQISIKDYKDIILSSTSINKEVIPEDDGDRYVLEGLV
jgi:hypothetical protein